MATCGKTKKPVSNGVKEQRKINNGDAINKRIIEKGRMINKVKSGKKK